MKLDSRILEGKKPLDCFDVDIAKQFIGHEGYFCDHRSGFTNIYNLVKDVLRDITPDDNYCEVYKTNCTSWEYFLPEEWIKEPEEKPEKKYRPFTLAEWIDEHEIGEVIHFRDKDYKQQFNVMYAGYIIDSGEDIQDIRTVGRIVFMYTGYFLEELFKDYEICINGEWQPFGIIDESQE